MYVVLMFLAFRGVDAFTLLTLPPGNHSPVISSMITSGIWTTALLIAIACRQKWARLILSGLLALTVVFLLIIVPTLFKQKLEHQEALYLFMGVSAAGYIGSLWCLLVSRSIKKLTDPTID